MFNIHVTETLVCWELSQHALGQQSIVLHVLLL